jgi:hypothetical protein
MPLASLTCARALRTPAFLNQIVRPVIDNALRTQINSFRCAELVSSCALVQNTLVPQQRTPKSGLQAQSSNANIAKVQNGINTSLAADLESTLGGRFVTNIHFNLVRVTLPDKVQESVDRAQAAFAQVSEAQAKVASARADADVRRRSGSGGGTCVLWSCSRRSCSSASSRSW